LGVPLLVTQEFEVVIMIDVVTEEMHGSDRVPDLKRLRASLGWQSKGNSFNESEMALFYECMRKCARKLLDTADIVRDAC
jgi:hypothetical protein